MRASLHLQVITQSETESAITCARVFLNSQTADAHEAVLIKLTQIVEQDCGEPIKLAYCTNAYYYRVARRVTCGDAYLGGPVTVTLTLFSGLPHPNIDLNAVLTP